MSRNFELLQNLGKEGALLDAPAPVELKVPKPSVEAVVREPQSKLEPKEREELSKLAQRIFLTPSADSPRVVVFTSTESGNECSSICSSSPHLLTPTVPGSVCWAGAN